MRLLLLLLCLPLLGCPDDDDDDVTPDDDDTSADDDDTAGDDDTADDDDATADDDDATLPDAPTVSIVFPPAPGRTGEDHATLTVTGHFTAPGGLAEVRVGGVPATVEGDAFSGLGPLALGANALQVEVEDAAGQVAAATVQVLRTATLLDGSDLLWDDLRGRWVIPQWSNEPRIGALDPATGGAWTLASDLPFVPGGLAWDEDTDRYLLVDRSAGALVAVAPADGTISPISASDATMPGAWRVEWGGAGSDAAWVVGAEGRFWKVTLSTGAVTDWATLAGTSAEESLLALDAAHDRLLVVHRAHNWLYEVSTATPDTTAELLPPASFGGADALGLDPATGLLWVLGIPAGGGSSCDVASVDPTDGTIAPATSVPALCNARGRLVLDGGALVGAGGTGLVGRWDPASGDSEVLSSAGFPDRTQDRSFWGDVAVSDDGASLVAALSSDAFLRLSLPEGGVEVMESGVEDRGSATWPEDFVLDGEDLVGGMGYSLVRVPWATGVPEVFSEYGLPDDQNPFGYIQDLDWDGTTCWVADGARVLAVDATTGARTVLSGEGVPDEANPLDFVRWLARDAARGRLLASVDNSSDLVAVDLATGARTVLATGLEERVEVGAIRGDQAWVYDNGSVLHAIDLGSDTLSTPAWWTDGHWIDGGLGILPSGVVVGLGGRGDEEGLLALEPASGDGVFLVQ